MYCDFKNIFFIFVKIKICNLKNNFIMKTIALSILIITLSCSNLFSQLYEYAFTIGGYGDDRAYTIKTDLENNVIISGHFTGTTDFDPSENELLLNSSGDDDIFIAKYTNTGTLLWAKSIGGYTTDRCYRMDIDQNNNIYITGTFSGTVDFDPGQNVNNLIGTSQWNIYFAKYDADGNYMWVKGLECGGGFNATMGISAHTDGSVYITGCFNESVDFDPSPNNYYLSAGSATCAFVAKYDYMGELTWAFKIGNGSQKVRAAHREVDNLGNIYVIGQFSGTIDFDPNEGETYLTSTSYYETFISKYNQNGELVWAKNIEAKTNLDGNFSNMNIDAQNNIYVSGFFNFDSDFDPK